jgi:predicted tellurium resistance membrane protein TerC
MRNRISAAMILGSTVILIGVLLLIRNLFNIDIPIFTIIISITLIWIGVMLIRGGQNVKSNEASTMFGESKMFYQKGKDSYKVMFGSGN